MFKYFLSLKQFIKKARKMLIKGLQKHTLIDYPGKIAATIFLFGCNFLCPYCHNPGLIDKEKAQELKTYGEQEILNFLEERKDFLEGVCITGGEPTFSPELSEFLRKIKQLDYKIKLDTNGSNPDMLKKLIDDKLVDYIAMDIKTSLGKYNIITSIDIEKIKESINIIKNFPEHEFRTTIVPGIVSKEDIIKIGKTLKGARLFSLQQFRAENCLNESFNEKEPYSEQELEEMKKSIESFFEKVEIK
jgi:pyruvate formate lyase activating enzyme